MKNTIKSPLPFQGQKRNFIKEFQKAIKSYPNEAIYIDLFGGSGLLSHTVKQEKPKAKVIYNDYDNFNSRLKSIPTTNKIIAEIRLILSHYNKKNEKVAQIDKIKILEVIESYEKNGVNIDYITLSSNLLFSMNYALNLETLAKETFYYKVRKNPYEAKEYLKGVEFEKSDYKELFNKYKNNNNVVFLVDPPYLSTDCSTYKNHWNLTDYLDVIKVLMNTNYLFFTSNKSQLIELFTWLETNQTGNPFKDAEVVYRYNSTSHNAGYQDIMVCKKWVTDTTL